MKLKTLDRAIKVLLVTQGLAACATPDLRPQDDLQHRWVTGTETGSTRGFFSKEAVQISPDFSELELQDRDYVVGPGDLLSLNIFGEPGMDKLMVRVDGNHRIQVPVIHSFKVEGMTLAEIQAGLTEAFRTEFKDPWVVVEISQYRSQPIYFIGEFNEPGVVYMERPTKLLEALGLAKGVSKTAYLRGARLLRDSRVLPVDVEGLLKDGRFIYNVTLSAGDTLYVPDQQELKIFVLGAVMNPGVQEYKQERTLLEVIAQGAPVSSAKLQNVRIIRSHSAIEGELIIADANKVINGEVPDLPLLPGDIVYVPKTILGGWNDVLSEIAPTISLFGATLEPFVQLKFLTEEDN